MKWYIYDSTTDRVVARAEDSASAARLVLLCGPGSEIRTRRTAGSVVYAVPTLASFADTERDIRQVLAAECMEEAG